MYLNSINSSACVVVSYSCKTLFDYCDRCLFFSFPCNFSTKGQIQHVRKPKRHDIFFSILNYWFTCLSSVGSPPFAKLFTLGNIISGISLNVQGFQTRSNCFEWKSLIKHGHSTKSNNFWSQSNFQFSYGSKWNSHKENYYRTKPNFLILNSWWQVCGFNSRFFYYCHIWSQF